MDVLHINKQKKKESNRTNKNINQRNSKILKSYVKNANRNNMVNKNNTINKNIYKNEENKITDEIIKSIHKEKDKIKTIKSCKNNDNIYDYIDMKYKKYFLEISDNSCSSRQYVFFESINAYELKKYNASKKIFNIIFEITKNNMKNLYEENNFLNKGWSDNRKMKELENDKCKLILGFLKDSNITNKEKYNFLDIIKSNDQKKVDNYLHNYKLVCFVHYRLTPDYYPNQKNIICYLYEIQIIPNFTKLGIGRHLIYMLENLCKNIKINKIICTVLKKNIKAVEFYKKKCTFEMDESSPDNFITDESESCEYEILKKTIV